jgi:hypothetical protein
MKIFCEAHGQPLDFDGLRNWWTCKIDGCLVRVTAEESVRLQAVLPGKLTEVWVAA